jgi:hypothetical protein
MPRAIVFVKGTDWDETQKKLREIMSQKDPTLINEFATITEYYLEAFGNPDFIMSLWSTNIEQLKSSILYIRKTCNVTTSTIIGIDENERSFRESEMKGEIGNLEKAENRIKQILKTYIKTEEERIKSLKKLL